MKSHTENQKPTLLIGDIGGTNARFALADTHSPGFYNKRTFQCADFLTADLAIKNYLELIEAPRPDIICIAAAGPIVDGNVRFTNNSWSLDVAELESDFDGARVHLLNDFEASAYSLPYLRKGDCLQIGSSPRTDLSKADYSIAVTGPGTGLGAAGLLKRNGKIYPIVSEGGHVGFAPETHIQMEILTQLRNEYDRVSDERLLSGPGIVNIYHALGRIRGERVTHTSAAEVFSLALTGNDATAAEAIQVFFEVLGQVAGNLALSLGATDGIFIGGGIVTRNPALIVSSRFRSGFEQKGRYRSIMEDIPTHLILHSQPGLLGSSYYALQMLQGKEPVS
jgi:glucokinase